MNLKDLKCVCENIDIENYIKYMDEVKKNMNYPDWLGDFKKGDLTEMLKGQAKIWMYFLEDEFVCSMMLIKAEEKTLQKFNIKLNVNDVIDYGPMFVNPKYVGNKLQYQMLCELDSYCLKLGYKYAIGTIHPENMYSINNLVKDNFVKIDEIELKRGKRNN